MAKKKGGKGKKGGGGKKNGGNGDSITTPTVSTDEVEETTEEGTWTGLRS